ncbi:hypothetical protein C7B80_04240 [Cyanosarcina cf. burmensis CCALA 770]|nr:hypothetical protein C7B80_04240 [Cyanosarcina cf. burmensis CCALA 770]
MKPIVQLKERQSDRQHSLIKPDPLWLTVATSKIVALLYVIGILFFILVPKTAIAFFSYVSHSKLTQISKRMNWKLCMVGLLPFSLATSTAIVVVVQIHNYFKQR